MHSDASAMIDAIHTQFLNYVQGLSIEDPPEVFGMHPNATLTVHKERFSDSPITN